ncbi:Uncharacterized protein TCAP_03043, partial [Tolypocladium capitatum]
MVSFFGLRLGGDKKKPAKAQGKQPQRWDRVDQDAAKGQSLGQNFSRPQLPDAAVRPGTANSTSRRKSNWRAVFGNPDMAASMTDLAPPKGPGSGGLRQHASQLSLRTYFAGGSTTSLARNPPDAAGRPGTPLGPAASKSPLGQFEFGVERAAGAADEPKPRPEQPYATGYPSPPQSDKNSERAFSPSPVPASSPPPVAANPDPRRNPGALATASLPSPASSAGDDRLEAPVVRNLLAKRDTFTFHQPRRPSFVMRFDDEGGRAARRTRHVEGFSGNFAAFDFGGGVPRPSADGLEPEPESPGRAVPASAPAAGGPPGNVDGPGRTSPPWGFSSRLSSEGRSRASPPRPLRPIQPSASIDRAQPNPRSAHEPPLDEGKRPGSRPPSSPFLRAPMEGDFP